MKNIVWDMIQKGWLFVMDEWDFCVGQIMSYLVHWRSIPASFDWLWTHFWSFFEIKCFDKLMKSKWRNTNQDAENVFLYQAVKVQ